MLEKEVKPSFAPGWHIAYGSELIVNAPSGLAPAGNRSDQNWTQTRPIVSEPGAKVCTQK